MGVVRCVDNDIYLYPIHVALHALNDNMLRLRIISLHIQTRKCGNYLRLQSLAMKWNAEFTDGYCYSTIHFEAVCGPQFMLFSDDVANPL